MTAPPRDTGAALRKGSAEAARRAARAGVDAPVRQSKAGKTSAARTSATRTRSAAAERAYAKRAQRSGRGGTRPQPDQRPDQQTPSRVSFVMLVIGLLTVGVVATLWLSTQAIQDSYRLDRAKRAATELAEREQRLQREVAQLDSAPRLAEEAAKAGMVDSGDPAHLIVRPNGEVIVVGEPKPAKPTAPQPPPAQPQQPAVPGAG
jgi:cell division protein FtsB